MTSKLAIVTGHTSGLGYSIAMILLSRGWTVIGVARQASSGKFGRQHSELMHQISGSVAEQETVDQAFTLADKLGGASLVINCAGQGVFGEAGSYSAADVHAVLEGNLTGLIVFSDRAVAHMRERGGTIVNIMSTAAKKYRPGESAYTAAKWGAKGYTRTLREAVKAQKLRIRVFEVYPCGMSTPFWQSAIRPVSDGRSFPDPKPIGDEIISAVLNESSSYKQEITFERS